MAKFRYSVLQSTDMADLSEKVNAALEAGCELAGGVSSVGDRHSGCVYHQAILERVDLAVPVKPARRPVAQAQAAEQAETANADATADAQTDAEQDTTA